MMESTDMTHSKEQSWEGFSLSRQQERLIARFGRQRLGYATAVVALTGDLREDILTEALNELANEQELLRTGYRNVLGDDGTVLMVIQDPAPILLERTDAATDDVIAADIQEYSRLNCIDDAEPLKARLYRQTPNRHTLVLALPRPSLDQRSIANLIQQLRQHYARLLGQAEIDPTPIVQYADFAQWQRDEPERGDQAALLDEWKERWRQVRAPHLPLALKSDDPTQNQRELVLSEQTEAALRALAQRLDVDLNPLLLAGWQLALWRVSGQPEQWLTVGHRPSRPFAELQTALGLFETTLPCVCRFEPTQSLADFIRHCAEAVGQAALIHESIPAGPLTPEAALPGDIGFTWVETDRHEAKGLCWADESPSLSNEPFKLELVVRAADRLRLTLRYQRAGFKTEGIEAVAQALTATLNAFAADASKNLTAFPLLTEAGGRALIDRLNPHADPGPADCWHRSFSRQAAATPDAAALIFRDREWSYAELDSDSNRLARHLAARGVKPGDTVGLMMDRSDQAIRALLAIHKAGAAYLPLDTRLPPHRLDAMLTQSRPALILCATRLEPLADLTLPVVALDAEAADIDAQAPTAPELAVSADDPAYVLYTSGSTGEPKGVRVGHGRLFRYAQGIIDRADLTTGLRYLSVGPLYTDLGNTSLFPALMTGGAIDLAPFSRIEEAQELIGYMAERHYDVLKLTPSHLASLFALCDDPAALMPDRTLILGGEMLSWGMLRLFRSFAGGCRIFNHYGPTETCVGVVAQAVESDEYANLASTVPLGRPMNHARCYVVDEAGRPLPLGVPGELYIGGSTVAEGYVKPEEAGASRFMPDPWSREPGACLYRSGDRVRYLPDGTLECLGRVDRQLKIRGFRVEPGEIEATLRGHERVIDACVVESGESGSAHLVAYVVLDDGQSGEADWLRDHLAGYLPDFMLPKPIVSIPRFPLTPAGKVDLRNLPDPDSVASAQQADFIAPRTDTERAVAEIFKALLLLNQVGSTDDFFDVGGHSLIATKLVAEIRKTFGIRFNLRSVFMDSTVAGISRQIDTQPS